MTHGARRWIRFYGPIGFQPSEIAKLALLVALCGMAARRGDRMRSLRSGLLPCMAVVGLTAGLILVEPDFGTAALIGIIGSLVVLVAGAPVWPMAAASSAGIAGAAVLVWRSPVRQARVLAFLDPAQHLDGAGYQLMHSLISLGSGGLLGRGLGASRQKLFFLPEPETDFIFAVIGEELGLIGALAVIFLFVLILWQGMKIASRARDSFGAAAGLRDHGPDRVPGADPHRRRHRLDADEGHRAAARLLGRVLDRGHAGGDRDSSQYRVAGRRRAGRERRSAAGGRYEAADGSGRLETGFSLSESGVWARESKSSISPASSPAAARAGT